MTIFEDRWSQQKEQLLLLVLFVYLFIYIFELLCQEFSSLDNANAASFGGV